jgi:hypothetical protein
MEAAERRQQFISIPDLQKPKLVSGALRFALVFVFVSLPLFQVPLVLKADADTTTHSQTTDFNTIGLKPV